MYKIYIFISILETIHIVNKPSNIHIYHVPASRRSQEINIISVSRSYEIKNLLTLLFNVDCIKYSRSLSHSSNFNCQLTEVDVNINCNIIVPIVLARALQALRPDYSSRANDFRVNTTHIDTCIQYNTNKSSIVIFEISRSFFRQLLEKFYWASSRRKHGFSPISLKIKSKEIGRHSRSPCSYKLFRKPTKKLSTYIKNEDD